MPLVSQIENAEVRDERDRIVGRVENVLFHPSEPEVVGLEVRRPPVMYVIPRQPMFLPIGTFVAEGVRLRLVGGPKGRARTEAVLGYSWDETVIWHRMPARTVSGERLGFVRDAEVSLRRGSLSSLALTEGAISDAALGARTVDAARVVGFDGDAVVVEDVALREGSSGGLAATAGRGTARAKVGAERLAVKAASGAAAAARVARRSQTARKATRLFRSMKKSILDATEPDDEE